MNNNIPTPADLVEAVRTAAVREPDRIAPEGAYFHPKTNNGCCIIGQAFQNLGVTMDDLVAVRPGLGTSNRWSAFGANGTSIDSLLVRAGRVGETEQHDDPYVRWLLFVQARQDEGARWVDAVNEADNTIDTPEVVA